MILFIMPNGLSPKARYTAKMLDHVSPNNIVNVIQQFTDKNQHLPYNGNQRKDGRGWDCSQMSANCMRDLFKNMQSTNVNFKTDFSQLNKVFTIGSTTVSQREGLEKLNIPKNVGREDVIKNLEVGQLIYMKYPKTKSGYSGHVAMVSRDPATGELTIAESNGKSGVTQRSVSDFFNKGRAAKSTTQFVSFDPLYKDRDVIRGMEKEANNFIKDLQLAEQKVKSNPYQKVGASRNLHNEIVETLKANNTYGDFIPNSQMPKMAQPNTNKIPLLDILQNLNKNNHIPSMTQINSINIPQINTPKLEEQQNNSSLTHSKAVLI